MNLPNRCLVIDDTPALAETLERALHGKPWSIEVCTETAAYERALQRGTFDVLVVSLGATFGGGGPALLEAAAAALPASIRIAAAEPRHVPLAERAVNQGGVFRFFVLPWNFDDVRASFHQAREQLRMQDEIHRLHHVTRLQNEALRQWAETLEARVETRTRELRESEERRAQSEKLAALGQLAGGVAHEINNPLGSILLFAQAARRELADTHAAARDLAEIESAARRGKRIVEGLLSFSRRARPEEREETDLAAFVRSRETLLRSAAPRLAVQSGGELYVRLHVHQFEQVLLNLLANADQAMQGEGTVRLALRETGEQIEISVEDDGPGIAPEHLAHVFEPFFTTRAPGKGTGLGLALVYGIVRDHGGEITAENLPEGGARFCIRLPRCASAQSHSLNTQAEIHGI